MVRAVRVKVRGTVSGTLRRWRGPASMSDATLDELVEMFVGTRRGRRLTRRLGH